MKDLNKPNEKRDEVPMYSKPSVRNRLFGLSLLHHNVGHFTVKFHRSREGIINHLIRIQKEAQEVLLLKKRRQEIREEFIQKRRFLRATNKLNRMLEERIKEEKMTSHLLDSKIAILKANKCRMLKLQEITKKELSYICSAIENVKERHNKDLTKYYNVVTNKNKLKDEKEKMKREAGSIQNILKQGKRDYTKMQKELNDLVILI